MNYLYRVAIGSGANSSVYIGQARTAGRIFQHLAGSHNRGLAALIAAAKVWPDISVTELPRRCLGDLMIGEDALIEIERDHARAGRIGECLNKRSGDSASWVESRQPRSDSRSGALLKRVPESDGTLWDLRTEKFCHTGNRRVLADCAQLLQTGKPLTNRFQFLDQPGTPIRRIRTTALSKALKQAGLRSVLMVHINDRVSGGRDALGPLTTPAEMAERCLKFWPTNKAVTELLERSPVDGLVATTGGANFRVIAGVWSVGGEDSNERGVWIPTSTDNRVAGLAGAVLTDAKYTQAQYPIWWVRPGFTSKQQLVWAGH